MDRILIEAWQQIEANERIDEKKRVAVRGSFKKLKKLKEDGAAAVGDGNPGPTAGGTMTQSGNAAKFKQRLGNKVNEDIKSDATNVARRAIQDLNSGKGTSDDSTLVGSMVTENLPEAPLPPGAEDIDLDDDSAGLDDGEGAPEVDGTLDGTLDDTDEVSTDAETASQVVDTIMKQYPGAVVTISIQLPDDTPFDTDLVAAAQEVVGGNKDELALDANVDGDMPEVGADSEISSAGEEVPEEIKENRKYIIKKTRMQIKEMFARMEGADDSVDTEVEPEVAPISDPNLDDVDPNAPALESEPIEPEVEVGDTKIALSPEQWGQVLATTDLLGGDDTSAELPVEELPTISDDNEDKLKELKTVVDINKDSGKMQIQEKIEKNDFVKNKNTDVGIKKVGMNESFNSELAGYSDALQRMIRN
jgi:hypothetical protein